MLGIGIALELLLTRLEQLFQQLGFDPQIV